MESGLDNRFWLLLIVGVPAAIYYSTKLYDRFKRRRLTGERSNSRGMGTEQILEIAQKEPNRRPPFILSIVLIASSLLLLAFGSFGIYLWIVGEATFKADLWAILFLAFFICAPIAVLVDSFFLEPRLFRLGKSLVFKDARAVLDGDIDTVFCRCQGALSAMHTAVITKRSPTLIKTRLGKSIITVKLRRRSDLKVGIHIVSDSQWLTVKLDGGTNQRNIDRFFSELSNH